MSVSYSSTILEHFRHPRNHGSLPAADVVHEVYNEVCGDRIRIELGLEGDVVAAARFRGDGCALSVAAASLLMERVEGLRLAEAAAFPADALLAALEADVPRGRLSCALLALDALRAGIAGHGGGAGGQGSP